MFALTSPKTLLATRCPRYPSTLVRHRSRVLVRQSQNTVPHDRDVHRNAHAVIIARRQDAGRGKTTVERRKRTSIVVRNRHASKRTYVQAQFINDCPQALPDNRYDLISVRLRRKPQKTDVHALHHRKEDCNAGTTGITTSPRATGALNDVSCTARTRAILVTRRR